MGAIYQDMGATYQYMGASHQDMGATYQDMGAWLASYLKGESFRWWGAANMHILGLGQIYQTLRIHPLKHRYGTDNTNYT